MKSLMVRDGDIVLTGGRLQTVGGKDKLVQDLSNWVRVPKGAVPTALNFGSLLPSLVGQVNADALVDEVRAEMNRLLDLYQRNQLEQLREDAINGHLNRWTNAEVLRSTDSVVVSASGPRISVVATVLTGVQSVAQLTATVTPQGVT